VDGTVRFVTLLTLAGAVLGSGCSDRPRELRWQVRFSDAEVEERVSAVEATIRAGGCAGEEVYRVSFRVNDPTGPTPPGLPPGRHGFGARAFDDACRPIALGCEEVTLPLEDGETVVVTVTAFGGRPACASDVCEEGICPETDGGVPDAGPDECPPGRADCNLDPRDACEVDTRTVEACGACGVVCQLDHATPACEDGVCVLEACDDGWADCDGADSNGCEKSLETLTDCGTCGNGCSFPHAVVEACDAGRCTMVSCHPGWADCDGMPSNGCEADLASAAHCGGCGTACSGTTPLCSTAGGSSSCVDVCPVGATMCGTACVDPSTDVHHCGSCGSPCDPAHASGSCVSGSCQVGACDDGWADCDGTPTNGCETSLTTLDDCGSCGSGCRVDNAVTSCVTQECTIDTCYGGVDDCDEDVATGCESDLASASSCGSCETSCAGARPVCGRSSAGPRTGLAECVEPAETACGDRCIDTDFDVSNCGDCGMACSLDNATEGCSFGSCQVASCDDGFGDCDGNPANGCEAMLASDFDNCGECGTTCEAGPMAEAACMAGECVLGCEAGRGDCNDDPSDGCETSLTTVDHCGGCGRVCDLSHASESCSGGSCTVTSCEGSFEDCDGIASNGCEADTDTDPDNCGSCGTECRPMVCAGGTCDRP